MEGLTNLLGEYIIEYKRKEVRTVAFKDSEDVARFAREVWPEPVEVREVAMAFYLNRANKVIGYYEVSKGGLSGTVMDSRLILHVALQTIASSVILVHNHPSGNIQPSDADKEITKRIREAGKLLDILLMDHIILTSDYYYSFADSGDL